MMNAVYVMVMALPMANVTVMETLILVVAVVKLALQAVMRLAVQH